MPEREIYMKYKATYILLQRYPYEIIVWNNKLYNKEELIKFIIEDKLDIEPKTLFKELATAIRACSNWKLEDYKEPIDVDKAIDDLLA